SPSRSGEPPSRVAAPAKVRPSTAAATAATRPLITRRRPTASSPWPPADGGSWSSAWRSSTIVTNPLSNSWYSASWCDRVSLEVAPRPCQPSRRSPHGKERVVRQEEAEAAHAGRAQDRGGGTARGGTRADGRRGRRAGRGVPRDRLPLLPEPGRPRGRGPARPGRRRRPQVGLRGRARGRVG